MQRSSMLSGTQRKGVRVAEFPPDSQSELLRQHHVLTVPTVLVLDVHGRELDRFEGESAVTMKAVQTRLAALSATAQ